MGWKFIVNQFAVGQTVKFKDDLPEAIIQGAFIEEFGYVPSKIREMFISAKDQDYDVPGKRYITIVCEDCTPATMKHIFLNEDWLEEVNESRYL